MANHDLAINHMAKWQVAEQLGEQIVCLDVVLCLHFAFKSVHFVQLFGFMITSTHEEVLREADFPGEHEDDDFDRKRTAVDKVTIEHVRIFLRWVPIKLENINQVVVLPVNVTAYCDLF